jgi:hypothetical protein
VDGEGFKAKGLTEALAKRGGGGGGGGSTGVDLKRSRVCKKLSATRKKEQMEEEHQAGRPFTVTQKSPFAEHLKLLPKLNREQDLLLMPAHLSQPYVDLTDIPPPPLRAKRETEGNCGTRRT